MAEALREKYRAPCSVELTIWGWLTDKEIQIDYTLYIPGALRKYPSWNELEDAFEKLIGKEDS